jgi:regulator of sigma E protease
MSLHALGFLFSTKLLPLMYAIIGFGALIAIHEFGHFIFCKIFGIHTPTFSIGFGPEIYRKQIGKTNFRLAAIPLGGYVEIAGLAETGQGEQAHAELTGPESFESKPYWQKMCVIGGGIMFNLLFAYLVFCLLFMVGTSEKPSVMVAGIVKESAADKGGLKPGDAIMQINNDKLIDEQGKLIQKAHEVLLQHIRSNPNKEITLIIERKNETLTLPLLLGSRTESGQTIGSLGAELRTTIQRLPFFQAIATGIAETNKWIGLIVSGIKRLITQHSLQDAGGPVMIMSMSFGAAQQGLMALLTFLALISINLALLNLIPLGALDGGQMLFITIEAIIGRKMPIGLRNGINIASWLLFIFLAVYLTYKDVTVLFGKKIAVLYKKVVGLIK